jgi:SulP family sulfate permease
LTDGGPGSIKNDALSGFTVALALVPEAVAFAFVAGISPVVGLYGAFMMGIITAIFGGRPGMISGATGAMAVVMVALVKREILWAMARWDCMMGFVNGLAIVIFLSQLGMFTSGGRWLSGSPLWTMVGLTLLTMIIMVGLPRLTRQVPTALAAIAVVSLIVIGGGIPPETVASFIASRGGDGISAGLPTFSMPLITLSWQTFSFIYPYAMILAAIGLIESLMTLNLIDE